MTDSVPFGIMITDAETRKSIVLLEAPILESKLQTMGFGRSFRVVLLPSSCAFSGEDDTSCEPEISHKSLEPKSLKCSCGGFKL